MLHTTAAMAARQLQCSVHGSNVNIFVFLALPWHVHITGARWRVQHRKTVGTCCASYIYSALWSSAAAAGMLAKSLLHEMHCAAGYVLMPIYAIHGT